MCCVKYLTTTFLVGLPAKINNPVPASQARFEQFRVIERFWVESSVKVKFTLNTLSGLSHNKP